MTWFSHYGVGAKVHAIERKPDGRVEFTVWATIFFIPLFPISSWSAQYAGEAPADGLREDAHCFTDLVRIKRDVFYHLQTFARAMFILALAIAPVGYMINRTNHRAATPSEMIFVFAFAAWPVVLVLWIERQRRRLLRKRQSWASD